jgi:hypothetical protein
MSHHQTANPNNFCVLSINASGSSIIAIQLKVRKSSHSPSQDYYTEIKNSKYAIKEAITFLPDPEYLLSRF